MGAPAPSAGAGQLPPPSIRHPPGRAGSLGGRTGPRASPAWAVGPLRVPALPRPSAVCGPVGAAPRPFCAIPRRWSRRGPYPCAASLQARAARRRCAGPADAGPGPAASPPALPLGACAALRASAPSRWPRCPPGSPSPRSARPLVPRRFVSGSPGVLPRVPAGASQAAPPAGASGPAAPSPGARRAFGPPWVAVRPRLVGGPGGPLGPACPRPRGLVAVSPCWAASAALVAVTLSP